MNRENCGRQKMKLIDPIKEKNRKSWILKTAYGKHSIYFSDFFFLLNQVPSFFVLRELVWYFHQGFDVICLTDFVTNVTCLKRPSFTSALCLWVKSFP